MTAPSRKTLALILFTLFALLPPLANAAGDPYLTVIATRILAFAIAALALDLILGYGGLVSFGHAAYIGIGAYATLILGSYGIHDLLAHLLAAMLAAALFALVTGAISLRTSGIYFIMITLAFAQMVFFFFVSLSAFGGDDGMALSARSTLFGQPVLAGDVPMFYASLVLLGLLYLLALAITGSRFGRILRGTRESPLRMQAIGISPFRYQLVAYVISGAMTAVAGVVLANQTSFVAPAYMNWHISGQLVVMVVLGGIGTLLGAIFGAVLAISLEEALGLFTSHWKLWFGLILIGIVLASRDGVAGLFRRGGRK